MKKRYDFKPSIPKEYTTKDVQVLTPCMSCKHITPVGDREISYIIECKAFPSGVPWEIVSGMNQHITPYKGDGGIVYEPREA